jgi:hypothetical protein
MFELSLIDRELAREVRRRQAQLWDALIDRLVTGFAGIHESQWTEWLRITQEELYEDLHFGRL